jgi:NADH-quinone oxidoreductase subunit M
MIYGIIAASGVIFAAVYMLRMFQRVMFGPIHHEENKKLKDLTAREFSLMIPIILLIVFIGLYPKPFLQKIDPSVQQLINRVKVYQPISQKSHDVNFFTVSTEDLDEP